MKTLIKGAFFVYGGAVKCEDMLIVDGKIKEIKPSIRIRGDEKIVDGQPFYILPGFIASMDAEGDEKWIMNGITTRIKKVTVTENLMIRWANGDRMEYSEEMTDYTYMATIPELSKQFIEGVGKNRIKAIQLSNEMEMEWSKLDWDVWLPRLQHWGIVLCLTKDERSLRQIPIPRLVPYAKFMRRKPYQLMHVKENEISSWLKLCLKMDPHLLQPYWMDDVECHLPLIRSQRELENLLMILAKVRSSAPAKFFGLYPTKGSIRIGADADLLFIDKSLSSHSSGSPFIPSCVMIKGKIQQEYKEGPDGKAVESWIAEGSHVKGRITYAFSF